MRQKQWILTDPATEQYGRKINESIYEFKERDRNKRIIDLRNYTNSEKEKYINAFGYTLWATIGRKTTNQNIFNLYPLSYNWIIAECIYESLND